MIFNDWLLLKQRFHNKRVAIVGSGPGVLDNEPGFIDSFDVVVRVNNYKLSEPTGYRTDVHYSFYGKSIAKTKEQLQSDGVGLCVCKCPDAKILKSSHWHAKRMKLFGIDYRYIYYHRKDFWFCPTFVPDLTHFNEKFHLLNKRVPTTGFAAILDIVKTEPEHIYITGFDFFQSRIHNVDEAWRGIDPSDPIGHDPEAELNWLKYHRFQHPISVDDKLNHIMEQTTWMKS